MFMQYQFKYGPGTIVPGLFFCPGAILSPCPPASGQAR
jgi:hypothetical protein